MRMYIHAAGGKEPAQVETIGSAFEQGIIRGDAWIAYARNLSRLADVAEAQGEADKARLLRLRSVAVGLEATDPSESTRGAYAEFLDRFISLILEMAESRLAQDLALQSAVERKLAWGDRHPAYAAGLDRLGEVLWARGDRTQAMLLYEKARDIRRAVLGEGHFELAGSSYRLALLHEEGDDRDEARRQAGKSLELSEAFVMASLPFLPERQRLAFLVQTTRALSLFLDVTGNGPEDVCEAYRHLLAWKGVATEAAAAQRAAAVPEVRVLSEELSRARDNLNQLFYAIVPPEQTAAHARQVRAQTKFRGELEARLAEAVRWHPATLHPRQIAEALPQGAVLVDFARYQHCVPAPGPEVSLRTPPPSTTHFRLASGVGPAMRFEARYVAFIVRPGNSQPVRVELGPAGPIDAAVMTWLDRIEHGGDLESPARQLAQDLWAPLAPYIGTARRVLISPDGPLNFLPWGALPGRSPGTYLVDDHAFSLVGAARFLAQGRLEADAPQRRTLLVVGGVDYALAEMTPTLGRERTEVAARSAPVVGRGLTFKELPGTLVEATAIIKLFGGEAPGGGNVVLLTGSRATKERVRSALGGKGYLHLATHGYFASPEFASALVPEDMGAPRHSFEGMDRSEVRGLYPGLLCGLVFAGANQPAKDPVTGVVNFGSAVMTAEEIAGLDLSGCELAVLSACETGRGSVAGGEGVLGLQRAFHQAGTRTVVASLWKVDDDATAALMAIFYHQLWRLNKPPIEALRCAQLALCRHPELVGQLATVRGTPDFDKLVQRPEPALGAGHDQGPRDRAPVKQWAAFVLSGWGK
jgi:CHAT domain-containing protein